MPRPVRHPGEMRWETRLLGTVTALLLGFGIAATYGAASLVTVQGRSVGVDLAVRQLSGALIGGVLLLVASRQDYYRWRMVAWPRTCRPGPPGSSFPTPTSRRAPSTRR